MTGSSNIGMRRASSRLLAAFAAAAAAACSDPTASSESLLAANAVVSASLSSVPVGYGDLASSYVGTTAANASAAGLWVGGGRDARLERGSLMGGGLADAFVGSVGFGGGSGGGHRGPFGGGVLGCAGAFDAATGRVTCAATAARNGLTVARSAAYANAAGAVQQAFDSLTTNTVNLQTAVSGTLTFTPGSDSSGRAGGGRGGHGSHSGHGACWGDGRGAGGLLLGDTATIVSASTTVRSSSDRTVTGLAQGSPQRTVNGTSSGNEATTGTSSRGSFSATRVVGDTTRGLVVPVQPSAATFPTAGTVIRAMQATLTYTGQATATASRREVVTYDGSATARVELTEDGTTRSCTRALPRGQLVCQ